MNQRIPIPESDKRIVRQEAFFGCVICGNPLIRYAHIIPYHISKDNRPVNLVALCPNDHEKYDLGAISEDKIREYKSNPFNKGKDVKDRFDVEGNVPTIKAGTNLFENTPVLLTIDDKNIVTLSKEEDELLLNAVFYDQSNNLLSYIKDNEWCALSGMIWDIEYHTVAKRLVIRTKPRDILLRLQIQKGIVHFAGGFYYNGIRTKISPSGIVAGNIGGVFVQRSRFTNVTTAIWFDTKVGKFGIGTNVHEHEYKKPIFAFLQKTAPLWEGFYRHSFVGRKCKFCSEISIKH